jgi:hypothetical protein
MMALAAFGLLSPAAGAVAHQVGTLIVLVNSASLAGRAITDLPAGGLDRRESGMRSCRAAEGTQYRCDEV